MKLVVVKIKIVMGVSSISKRDNEVQIDATIIHIRFQIGATKKINRRKSRNRCLFDPFYMTLSISF